MFGPCNPPASACGAGNRGATTQHCGGPWSCDCSAGSAPAPAPAPAPPPAPAPAPAPPAQGCGWTALEATFGPCNPPSAACGTGNQGATTFACGGNWACRCSAAAAPPAQRSCMWETKNFVVGPCNGPGCNANAHPCGVSNAGATGEGGGGTWTCVCR
ncbi:MAG: hypothetical protein M0D55_17520 [Elusimicrobiota bacterium]|nr:MAG: hypothetical protein M0D55_17520 [Elusimicrobiota bacterium]